MKRYNNEEIQNLDIQTRDDVINNQMKQESNEIEIFQKAKNLNDSNNIE